MKTKAKPGDLITYKLVKIAPLTANNLYLGQIYTQNQADTVNRLSDQIVIDQTDAVQIHLMQFLSVTDTDVRSLYGIGRLGARIYDLRQRFMALYPTATIETEIEKGAYGKRYARYYLHDLNDEVRLPEVCKQLEG